MVTAVDIESALHYVPFRRVKVVQCMLPWYLFQANVIFITVTSVALSFDNQQLLLVVDSP